MDSNKTAAETKPSSSFYDPKTDPKVDDKGDGRSDVGMATVRDNRVDKNWVRREIALAAAGHSEETRKTENP